MSIHKAFKEAWESYPSQDNEGYLPERAGFKCGFFAGAMWKLDEDVRLIREFKRNWMKPWRDQLIELVTRNAK